MNLSRKREIHQIINKLAGSSFQNNFCEKKPTQTSKKQQSITDRESSIGTTREMIYKMRTDAKEARVKNQTEKGLFQYNKQISEHLVELTYYMDHRDWKSQYIYCLLNYNKLGFKIMSDYHFLDSASYMLELRKLKPEQMWPTIRCIIGLRPRVIVTGSENIEKFFLDNFYFSEKIRRDGTETELLKKHLETHILPYMESLIWHPTLTYQTVMHTESYYFTADQKNYMIVGVLRRNLMAITKEVFKNLINISREKQRYLRSKEKFSTEVKALSQLYLAKSDYFGGNKPNFIDFYFYAHLRTKWNSRLFKNFLVEQISPDFKSWVMRMGWSCEYVKDRVTLL